jgi:alkanesulfonate monooxygenase SsuD/methylene tetrahydromethanopterin reductase-like flavin-dependent oxidoreductase (luciferase family)
LLLERAMLAGPPAHVAEQVQELREVCGIENLITFMDAGGVPHDKIMRSLELFGTKVMPAFKAS